MYVPMTLAERNYLELCFSRTNLKYAYPSVCAFRVATQVLHLTSLIGNDQRQKMLSSHSAFLV